MAGWTKPPALAALMLLLSAGAGACAAPVHPFLNPLEVHAVTVDGGSAPLSATQGGAWMTAVAMEAAQTALRAAPQFSVPAVELVHAASDTIIPATTLPATQLEQLPLTGGTWQSLLPGGMSQGSGSHDEETATDRNAAPIVDGADTRLGFGGGGIGRTRGPGHALIGPASSETALRELEMGSASPEVTSDHFEAGRVRITTERGGASLHGHQTLVDRQNILGARNPFSQWIQQTEPATATTVPTFTPVPYTPGNHEMTWSVGAGGPLYRHRLFWFAALEGFEGNNPAVSTVKHPDNFFAQPSNDQMQVLSARLGLSSTNPVGEGLKAYFGMLSTLDGLLGPALRVSKRGTGFLRGDWDLSARQRFTLEGAAALWHAFGGGSTSASEDYGTHSYGSSRVDDQWILARWEAFLTSHAAAVTQVSVGRQFVAMPPQPPSAFEQTLDINAWRRLPQISVDSRYGFTIGNPSRFGPGSYPDEHLIQAQEQFSWTRGTGLQIKAGGSFRHAIDAIGLLRNQAGTYHYASVENFASDALAFAAFGLSGQLNPLDQHNCDQTGRVWRDTAGTLHGLGYLPCYEWYSQTMGPANWWLNTSDWGGYVTAESKPRRTVVASLAMRWDLQQAPPAIELLHNPDLPLTQSTPTLGSQWGPRAGLAWGAGESRWPVLRVGYGLVFGRTPNVTLQNALTQTGSLQGDLNYFLRPTDNLNAGGAPPFPYVLAGQPGTAVKPSAVEFGQGFRNGEAHQLAASMEESLPSHVHIDVSALASLGRRLPVTEDANIDPAFNPQTITYAVVDGNGAGPIKKSQITVPFFASWPSADSPTGFAGRINPNYQRVTEIFSSSNSTYEAAIVRITRNSREGLTLHARYTYAHAADWNPNESATITGPSVFDPTDPRADYGASDLDVRHSASAAVIWQPHVALHSDAGRLVNGWMFSAIGSMRSGLPYSMRTAGSLAKEFDKSQTAIVALAPGMNGYGGTNLVYGVGRNTYRYPATWKADLRVARHFNLGPHRQIELFSESFNFFNHQNVTELETVGYSIGSGSVYGSLPTLNFLTGLKTGQTEFGHPLNVNATDFFRPRQIQFGIRTRF
ncbi:MAG TPA: hypothetical protein VHW46_02210 [Terracidiphilus sp.]|nr:hypothetical protein [Terracidiphilus sp.]